MELSLPLTSRQPNQLIRAWPRKRMTSSSSSRCSTALYLYRILYGAEVAPKDMLRFLALAVVLLIITVGFRILQSTLLPVATYFWSFQHVTEFRLASNLVFLPMLLCYNLLLACSCMSSTKTRHYMGYYLGVVTCAFSLWACLTLIHPEGKVQTLWKGFVFYIGADTLGRFMLCFFWSFLNSHLAYFQSVAVYGVILGVGQIGGSSLGGLVVQSLVPNYSELYLLASLCFGGAVLGLYLYLRGFQPPLVSPQVALLDAPQQRQTQDETNRYARANYCCGKGSLCAALSDSYTWGIILMEVLYAMETVILDHAFKSIIKVAMIQRFPCASMPCQTLPEKAATGIVQALTTFGSASSQGAIIFALVGTSFVLRNAGLPRSLVLSPLMGLVAVFFMVIFEHSSNLSLVMAIIILVKVFGDAIFIPSREMLYMPTNAVVRYHLRPWITIVLTRWSKGAAFLVVTQVAEGSAPVLWTDPTSSWSPTTFTCLVALGTAFGLVSVSVWMGRMCTQRLRQQLRSVIQQEGEEEGLSLMHVASTR
jgi:hypothetical protein